MLVSYVLIASLILQFVAIYFALRLIKVTGKSLAWGLVATAIVLMALRRGTSLVEVFTSDHAKKPNLEVELIALAISAFMAIGIERITPIFQEIRSVADRLKESEARLRSIFTVMEEGVLFQKRTGEIITANLAAERILGQSAAELFGQPSSGRVRGDRIIYEDGSAFPDELHPALVTLQTGKPQSNVVMGIYRSDGTCVWISVNSQPLLLDNEFDPYAVVTTFRDITQRKQAEEALRRYKDQLEETIQQRTAELQLARNAAVDASKAKSIFLANMSHELRTPLNAILGFSSMMRRDPQLSESQRENLDIINRSGEHLLNLINDVLEMSKIEAGRLQLEIAPFDLGGMVRDVADMMRLRAEDKGLQLLLDQSSEFPRYIKGDEAHLRQILVNLVSNAVKFTQQGGVTIRLGVKQNTHQHLLIEVEDSGPGITEEDQARLFEPFVQLAQADTQKGTGLGLAITRQFVQLMGGTISVESSLGKGSLFRVELSVELAVPSDILQTEQKERGEVAGLAPGQPHYRILIAEDQHENLLLLSKLMAVLGLEVRAAENGEQCVKLFQDWQPDLIWMDRRMPVMDGVEATKRIRQLPEGKAVKIVAVTASAFREQQQEMLDAGMDAFVRKPYRFDEIYDCLSRQLGIKYIYTTVVPAKLTNPVALTPEMLAVLPPLLRKDLMEATESLDSERITTVIRQIGEVDAELGRVLSGLAEYFDYPAILKVLIEAWGQPSG